MAVGSRNFEQVLVNARLVAIAVLVLATGYLLGTRGSNVTADRASAPAGSVAAPAAGVPSDPPPRRSRR